jgi:hypothetical protein
VIGGFIFFDCFIFSLKPVKTTLQWFSRFLGDLIKTFFRVKKLYLKIDKYIAKEKLSCWFKNKESFEKH